MHSRTFHYALLAWTVAWFVVVLPGHDRGAVRLPGAADAGADCSACRPDAGRDGGVPVAPCRSDLPRHCAVCQFIGVLNVPPPVMAALPIDVLVRQDGWPLPQCPTISAPPTTHAGRGPPVRV